MLLVLGVGVAGVVLELSGYRETTEVSGTPSEQDPELSRSSTGELERGGRGFTYCS